MADGPYRSPGMLALFGEARFPVEAASLLPALPALLRAPKGDGHAVITIPPFGAGDAFTTVLRTYLGRLGYQVNKWGASEILAFHRLNKVAVRRLREVAEESGSPVSLIGHSLGGIYAREVARAAPEYVRRVITVGSPFAGDLKSNIVWPMYEAVTGTRIKSIPRETMARLNDPLPLPSTAIFSRSDGVVSWKACIDVEAPLAENVEVTGSHIGLLHNPTVFFIIADRLAQREGEVTPYDPSGWMKLAARHGPARDRLGP